MRWIAAAAALAGLVIAARTLAPVMTSATSTKSSADPERVKRLRAHVSELAGDIGERNHNKPQALAKAEAYVKSRLGKDVRVQEYRITGGRTARNYEVVLPAADDDAPVLVIGAHYDTADGTPGADDNASGVAVLLELARSLEGGGPYELRLVAYGTEEPPYFWTDDMGSVHHAKALKKEGRRVVGMASLEMLGYYDTKPGSQHYPAVIAPFYPKTADFLGVVGTWGKSSEFLKRFAARLVPPGGLKVVASRLPRFIPEIGYSDNWSYWEQGMAAVMVTDTSFLRYPHYHTAQDTPDKLDYERLADACSGIEAAIKGLGR